IKFRESFRPFAPSILEERMSDCFELSEASPYMLLVASVSEALRTNGVCSRSPVGAGPAETGDVADPLARLRQRRSTLPAVTHVDYSARVQTVAAAGNPRFHRLLSQFEQRTGCPVLVNTSFNVRGEPPVCTPEDAYRCFMKTEMDYVVLGNCLLDKRAIGQHASKNDRSQTATPKKTAIWKSPFFGGEPHHLDSSVAALRRFAFTIAPILGSLGGLMLWRQRTAGWPLLSLAALLLALSLLAPGLLRFVHRPWMMLALFVGSIASKIILTLAFFLVVTPIGLLQRLFGKTTLDFVFRSSQTTYWKARGGTVDRQQYERQF
ncbi:MAG TPA: SxtJ family membrane protein, partial [Chthoniobacterales bacterium]|nr:SxtJ family membrane protein [Chthoniobacterales bacterium]